MVGVVVCVSLISLYFFKYKVLPWRLVTKKDTESTLDFSRELEKLRKADAASSSQHQDLWRQVPGLGWGPGSD